MIDASEWQKVQTGDEPDPGPQQLVRAVLNAPPHAGADQDALPSDRPTEHFQDAPPSRLVARAAAPQIGHRKPRAPPKPARCPKEVDGNSELEQRGRSPDQPAQPGGQHAERDPEPEPACNRQRAGSAGEAPQHLPIVHRFAPPSSLSPASRFKTAIRKTPQ